MLLLFSSGYYVKQGKALYKIPCSSRKGHVQEIPFCSSSIWG